MHNDCVAGASLLVASRLSVSLEQIDVTTHERLHVGENGPSLGAVVGIRGDRVGFGPELLLVSQPPRGHDVRRVDHAL